MVRIISKIIISITRLRLRLRFRTIVFNLALSHGDFLGMSSQVFVEAFLPGCIHALLIRNRGTPFIFNIIGHSCRFLLTNFLGNISADVSSLIDVITDLSVGWLANPLFMSFALKIRNFFVADFRDQRTDTSGLWLTVSAGNLMARLYRESLAIFLWNLVAVKFRDFLALVLWRCATLLLWSLSANGFWNRKAFIFVDSIALFHQGLTAFLPWHVPALLSINLSTTWWPVRIVGISTDLLGNWLAFLFVNSLTVTVWNFLAIPLWNLVTFFLLNDMTFLGRNMITYLFIYELAVLFSDDLTSCFRAKNALFLMALTANFLESCVTLLIVFSLAILLMDCFVNSPRNADTQELWDVVALFILDFVTSFSGILGSLTFLLK